MNVALAVLLAVTARPADRPPVVAVSYFDNNTGQAELAPLAKGLADMLITDLAALPGLQVVEREKLNEALAELKLSRGPFIDPRTAQKLGRGLAARYLLTGGFTLAGSTLRIDVRLFEVETGAVVASESAQGSRDEFFELESRLVSFLARAIELKVGPGRGAGPPPGGTRSFQAWTQYSTGLDAQDRGDAARAREMFEKALRTDPGYQAARTARERLAAIFAREARQTTTAARQAFAGLDPGAPDLAAKVETLLSGLDIARADQLAGKLEVLSWLGERGLLACTRREGPALGNPGVVSGGVPLGGVISHCPQAADVLVIAYRLRDDPSQWEVIPRVCEYFLHQLPGDRALLHYCEKVLMGSVEKARAQGEKAARKRLADDRKEAARLPATHWKRALIANEAAMKAMLAVHARAAEGAGQAKPR